MKLKYLSIFVFIAVVICTLSGCQTAPSNAISAENTIATTGDAPQKSDQLYREQAYYLYTQVEITTYGKLEQAVYQEIWSELDRLDHLLSMRDEKSEIAKINASAGLNPVKISGEVFNLIKQALDYSVISNDFDISIGSLVQLWGIGTENARVPAKAEIEQALSTIDYRNIVLNENKQTVLLKQKNMAIDLGSIAKGYAANLTKQILLKHGIDRAIINFGGNILTIGDKANGTAWRVGIQTPDEARGSYLGVLKLNDNSVVTSGNYERFFEKNGKRYHHILSTKTGYPVDNELASVSIIASDSMVCDALSTLIFIKGVENGLAIIEAMPDAEAILITKDKKVYLSSGLSEYFALKDERYQIVESVRR